MKVVRGPLNARFDSNPFAEKMKTYFMIFYEVNIFIVVETVINILI